MRTLARIGLGSAALILVAGSACTPASPPTAPAPTAPTPTAPTTPSAPSAAPSTPAAPDPALVALLDTRVKDLPGRAGMAVVPVGGGPMTTVGDFTTGPAWSTSKVPLAIAAQRASGTPADQDEASRSAITASDNAAAETLWGRLGEPHQAAYAVEQVLHEHGSPEEVPAQPPVPGYSAFGQTQWSVADQATFMAAAACRREDAPVLTLMGEITEEQAWGLGVIGDATQVRFKGGWGPDPDGTYLTRQLGVVTTSHGQYAIAVAVDGVDFDRGTALLSEVGDLLAQHADAIPAGHC